MYTRVGHIAVLLANCVGIHVARHNFTRERELGIFVISASQGFTYVCKVVHVL